MNLESRLFISEMETYTERLGHKARVIVQDFDSKISDEAPKIAINQKLFKSMKRWHKNSHISENDWKTAFTKIEHKLDVLGKMKLDEDFKSYLDLKFKQTSLVKAFSVTPILEFLDSDIRRLYKRRMDARAGEEEDEFSEQSVFDGMRPENMSHFSRVFLPAAYFYTYLEIHSEDDRLDLMDDVFTIGSGSMTHDLFPEVTGICVKCAVDQKYANFSETDIDTYNIKLLEQMEINKFKTSLERWDSSESEGNESSFSKEMFWYNPFDSSSSSEDVLSETPLEETKTVSSEYACQDCTKVFSKKEYLIFHRECFHKGDLPHSVQFVGDPPDLITSFHQDSETISSRELKTKRKRPLAKGEKVQQKTEKVVATRVLRKRICKELKFSK